MLSYTLGPDVLQAGLRQYLKDHAYNTTVAQDLWLALTKVAFLFREIYC